ncbi:hypothetical protein L6452_03438 [Arctium lappa]|uniref:Uncharacterized protein n=1 Tax=Arctium lappa TaxID=4217 RepID=A0ACB9FNF6_ARCLA|nr:hypothetical protein L6452_03438 [Arctium lappa]
MKAHKDDTWDFTTKLDTFDLVSFVDKGNEKEVWGSSTQEANMHYPSSHGKCYKNNSMISLWILDEHHESPKNDESQRGITRGNLVFETVTSAESLIMPSPPANLGSTDAGGVDSVVQTILRTTEIATNELLVTGPTTGTFSPIHGGKRKWVGDSEDGSIDKPSTNNSHLRTWSQFPKQLDNLSELPSYFFKVEEDGKGDSLSKDKKFNLSAMNKQEKGASSTKNDRFELLSSPVEDKEDDEGDSATRNAHLDGPSHGKGNEDDGVIFFNPGVNQLAAGGDLCFTRFSSVKNVSLNQQGVICRAIIPYCTCSAPFISFVSGHGFYGF